MDVRVVLWGLALISWTYGIGSIVHRVASERCADAQVEEEKPLWWRQELAQAEGRKKAREER